MWVIRRSETPLWSHQLNIFNSVHRSVRFPSCETGQERCGYQPQFHEPLPLLHRAKGGQDELGHLQGHHLFRCCKNTFNDLEGAICNRVFMTQLEPKTCINMFLYRFPNNTLLKVTRTKVLEAITAFLFWFQCFCFMHAAEMVLHVWRANKTKVLVRFACWAPSGTLLLASWNELVETSGVFCLLGGWNIYLQCKRNL